MKNTKFKICDTYVHPGEIAHLAMPLPEQYSCSPLYMPIKVIHGHQKGPTILILSVFKGTELNGLEIANRLVKSIKPEQISGTIIAIPVVNVYGLTHYPQNLPSGANLADCFPGDESGSYGQRMAHLITEEILKKSDYCIELQTGDLNHNILPQVYCDFKDNKAKALARIFKTPVITDVESTKSSLREVCEELQIPLLVYQAGEARRFDENVIDLGVSGIRNVLKQLNILPQDATKEVKTISSRDEEWMTAPKGGILHTDVNLGQIIEKNDLIGKITDPFSADVSEKIYSPQKGIIVGVNTSPLVHEGSPTFKLASFLDYDKAETAIEEWDKKQPDSYIG